MRIRDVMTTDCAVCTADTTIQEAARLMADKDIGFVPVARDNKMVGTLTDRDIVVRGIAVGKSLELTKVTDLMTDRLYYCYDDQDCLDVAANMAELEVRRLPVVDRDKNLIGTVTLGDLAQGEMPEAAGHALAGITKAA